MKRNSVVISMVFCTLLQASEKFTPINPAVAALTAAGQDNLSVIKPPSPLVRPELSELEKRRKEDERLHYRMLAKGKSFMQEERVKGMVSSAPQGVEHPGAVVYFERPDGQKQDEDGYFIDETLEDVSEKERSESQWSESSDRPSQEGESLGRILTQMTQKDREALDKMKKNARNCVSHKRDGRYCAAKDSKDSSKSGLANELEIDHKMTITIELSRQDDSRNASMIHSVWIDETVAACKALFYGGVGALAAVIAYQIATYHQSDRVEIIT